VGMRSPFRRRRRAELDQPQFGPASDPSETYRRGPAREDETLVIPSAASSESTDLTEPVEVPFGARRSALGWFRRRFSPIAVFAIAFLFLLAAVAAVGFAQFTSSGIAPWLSIGYSAVAVVCTIVALVVARER